MIFIVELLAVGNGEIREVEIVTTADGHGGSLAVTDNLLNAIFIYGQNENQPQDKPSVSAGDVIHINQDRWLIMAVGFKKLTPSEYILYKEMPRDKRLMIPYLSTP